MNFAEVNASAAPSVVRAWALAARPATLPASVVPVAVGSAVAYAEGGFAPLAAAAALLGALAIQIGTNLANDVYDYEKGADTAERVGPARAVQQGWLTPSEVRSGMTFAFALAVICGLYLTWQAGPVVIAIGVLSILSGLAYTAGPWPLAYVGLGDLFVMIFFGFVAVIGTAFVQLGQVPQIAIWASVPVGAIATAILAVNNLRDRRSDAVANKRTLAVRFGRTFTVLEYAGLLLISYAVPPALVALELSSAWVLLPLITLPLAALLVRAVAKEEGAALNARLGHTGRLMVAFGVLLALGIVM